ncbi:hypothetical protein ACQJBY_007500 [Aegilops geniculata]
MYRAAAAAAAAISRSSSSVVRRELARGGVYRGAEQHRWARRFAAKDVNFGFDARAAILRGVNDPAPADAVKGTYVMFTVAKNTELDESAEKVGASLVASADGTTRGSVTMEGLKAWMMDSTYQTNQEYPLILSVDKKLLNINSLVPALQIFFKNYRPLLIFAEDADGEALSMLNKPHAGLMLVRRFEHRRLFTTNTRVADPHKEKTMTTNITKENRRSSHSLRCSSWQSNHYCRKQSLCWTGRKPSQNCKRSSLLWCRY